MAEPALNWNGALEHAELSDVGLRRANNQDSLTVFLAGSDRDWQERGHLFMVADGMGAHAAGELASKLATSGIPHTYHKLRDRSPPEAIRQAILETNAHIHERGCANADFQGMGTTASVLVLLPGGALVAHVGDSRVYRVHGSRIEQLTFDHSLVWEMKAAGQLSQVNVAGVIPKNIITRSLGPRSDVQVDLEGPFGVAPGDVFLLCSDGLSGQLEDEELGVILSVFSPHEAAQVLVDLANLRGGPDNISVVVVRVPSAAGPTEAAARSAGAAAVLAADPATDPVADASTGAIVQSLVWIVAGMCALAAVGMFMVHKLLPAGLCAAGAAVAALVGLAQRIASRPREPRAQFDGVLGKGPYVTRDCVAGPESTAAIAQMAQKLREAAVDEQWGVDWTAFNRRAEAARLAAERRDYAQSVRDYGLAIIAMMSEIRRAGSKKGFADGALLEE